MGRPISSSVKGIDIELTVDLLCDILEIHCMGLCLFKSKGCPSVDDFDVGRVVQRLCDLPMDIISSRPHTHALSITSRVFHHMISYIFIPKGRHKDEVSYKEAFFMNSILTGWKMN